MFKTMTGALAASTFALTLVAGPGLAQDEAAETAKAAGRAQAADYSAFDSDGTPGISSAEFRAAFQRNQAFATWDDDDDGNLTKAEFEAGLGNRQERFEQRFGENWFETWDEDGSGAVSETEYYEGLHGSYDTNRDGMIDEPEYSSFGQDMGEDGWFEIE